MALNPADFFVSEKFGFVLEKPLVSLAAYFEPWNHLAQNMRELVASNTMRQQVEEMPLLDWTRLNGHREKRLAHFQLTILASGYVWQEGDKGAAKSLPACVSVPLHHLSQDLGLPMVICHADLALANYALIDSSKPMVLENLKPLYCLPGGEEAAWFVVVTVMVELTFAKGIQYIMKALHGVEIGDEVLVTAHLRQITKVVHDMQLTLSRMHDKLRADTFFNKLRPFLGGWGGDNNPLPDGLIYEGVSNQPVCAIGGSAAQSATMQVLDALLSVQHSTEKKDFLLKMRGYMPPAHQRFIKAIENQKKSLQDLVKGSLNEELHDVYNSLLSAMIDFRSYHIQIVTKYVVQAASKANQSEEKRFESLDKKGTGGTSLLPFLKELREDTRNQLMNSKTREHDADVILIQTKSLEKNN